MTRPSVRDRVAGADHYPRPVSHARRYSYTVDDWRRDERRRQLIRDVARLVATGFLAAIIAFLIVVVALLAL